MVEAGTADKPVMILMARAHPGETGGSFMLRGAVHFLMSQHKAAVRLRQKFRVEVCEWLAMDLMPDGAVQVVPMVNPDGVELGNSRCNRAPCDLNRQWGKSGELLNSCAPEVRRVCRGAAVDLLLLLCSMQCSAVLDAVWGGKVYAVKQLVHLSSCQSGVALVVDFHTHPLRSPAALILCGL